MRPDRDQLVSVLREYVAARQAVEDAYGQAQMLEAIVRHDNALRLLEAAADACERKPGIDVPAHAAASHYRDTRPL